MEVERRASHQEDVTKAARQAARATAWKAATGYFLLILVLLVGAWVFQKRTDKTVHSGLLATCERVNTVRIEESNRNAQVVWAALYYSQQREKKLPGAVHRASAQYIKQSIDAMRWGPQTNCEQAVNHPESYKPPMPRKFDPSFLDFSKVPK